MHPIALECGYLTQRWIFRLAYYRTYETCQITLGGRNKIPVNQNWYLQHSLFTLFQKDPCEYFKKVVRFYDSFQLGPHHQIGGNCVKFIFQLLKMANYLFLHIKPTSPFFFPTNMFPLFRTYIPCLDFQLSLFQRLSHLEISFQRLSHSEIEVFSPYCGPATSRHTLWQYCDSDVEVEIDCGMVVISAMEAWTNLWFQTQYFHPCCEILSLYFLILRIQIDLGGFATIK